MAGRVIRDAGAGEPLLCLHGIGSGGAAFDAVTPLLADRFRVIARDAPGYASAADPPGPPGMDGYADAAVAVLDGLGLERAHVLGVSWGGVIAARIALRHPDRLRSLILADSTRGSGTSPEKAAAMRARGAELAGLGPAAFARRRAARLLSPAATPREVARVAEAMAAAVRMPGYGYAAESMAATDHGPLLGRIRARALVLVGEHDAVCPPAESRLIAAAVPGARYAEIPGAGHLSNQERPAEFARAVRDFLVPDDLHLPDDNEGALS
ncbi:alpha/beta fold hydrolase [Actinomadura viridis]|uniref:Pimeloyl-ACP methyl ester carboxylesterase n=1 Tax=Actinomadura viridis TaxID=58110 RepID=A0A931DG96_9ACTN|nr:alpha/beta fold hydrolase [Actinomadura viridis]MBG6087717.1 pimeloyl-ACP methyl ester carboxylesterase [Actinomadura viridis]